VSHSCRFGGVREQKSMSPIIVDTGRDVYPNVASEKCRYIAPGNDFQKQSRPIRYRSESKPPVDRPQIKPTVHGPRSGTWSFLVRV